MGYEGLVDIASTLINDSEEAETAAHIGEMETVSSDDDSDTMSICNSRIITASSSTLSVSEYDE